MGLYVTWLFATLPRLYWTTTSGKSHFHHLIAYLSESELSVIKANPINDELKALLATFKSTYSNTKVVLASTVLPFAALHRAVSATASFILLLFIHWKFHVTDG